MRLVGHRVSHMTAGICALVLMLGFLLGIQISAAPQATAHHCGQDCIHTGIGDGGPPSTPGGNGPGNPPGTGGGTPGGGGGGGGAVVVPPQFYSFRDHVYSTSSPPVPGCVGACGSADARGGSVSSNYGGRCRPPRGTAFGDYEGVEWWSSVFVYDPGSQGGGSLYTSAGYRCITPPSWEDSPIMCASHYGAELEGPMRPGRVPIEPHYEVKSLDNGRQPTQWTREGAHNGPRDVELCQSEFTKNYRERVTHLGQYRIYALGSRRQCILRTYTRTDRLGQEPPRPDLTSCLPPQTNEFAEMRGQKFCRPPQWELRWTNDHTFTWAECLDLPPSQSPHSCGPNILRPGLYAGRTAREIDAIDDGKNRLLQWRTVRPDPRTVRNISGQEMRLDYMRGTPYRRGSGPSAPDQPFVAEPKVDLWHTGWRGAASNPNRSGWDINFQAEGLPGEPWTVVPRWRFDAEILQEVIYLRSINFETGTVTFDSVEEWVYVEDEVCSGVPARLNVHRARNASN